MRKARYKEERGKLEQSFCSIMSLLRKGRDKMFVLAVVIQESEIKGRKTMEDVFSDIQVKRKLEIAKLCVFVALNMRLG